jgi:hypothetical protein
LFNPPSASPSSIIILHLREVLTSRRSLLFIRLRRRRASQG